ncbi:MAG: PEP-CTERM sorting domain-containing protein [Caldilineaceae bacterium]|nr:PEP-CTERM sorting domain-containing protein [Planctomycetales bacterium]MCB0074103.1 PEP-CTERM sorting domain-containing protein [Caldilineaceae bacterium]
MKRLVALAVAACISGTAIGADFYPIAGASSSTGGSDLWPASNLIQGPGVGFDAAEPHAKILGGADGNWVTAADAGFPSDYIEQVGQPVLTFDLGSDVALNEISVWGYAATNSNGASEFTLKFSTAAEGAGGGSASAGPFALAGDLTLGTNDDTSRQSFSYDMVTARYVEMTITDNFFNAPGDGSVAGSIAGGDRAGLGEVAFQQVPEPSSVILALLGSLALMRFRKR